MKRLISLCCVFLTTFMLLSACGKKADPVLLGGQLGGPQDGDTIAVFETSMGTFKALLFADEAPLAVANFIALANDSYYNDLIFHRVVADSIIQSGDPTGLGSGGESASGSPFKDEYSDYLHHYAGALGMANAGADLNQSQFYVVQGMTVSDNLIGQMRTKGYAESVIEAYEAVGGLPTLDYRYTVFGQVYEGLDVVEKINQVETDDSDRPNNDVKLIRITIETYSAPDSE